jgi:hypothetical protein
MKYQCAKCNEVFTHTAKQVLPTSNSEDKLGPTLAIGINPVWVVSSYVETYVCPFCHNVKFSEYIEPVEELEDVISVEYVNVGAKIAEGYKVKEIYAKSVTLVKPKKKVEGDYIQEAMEKARQP